MKILIVGINSWYIFHFWMPLIIKLKKNNNIYILSEHDEFTYKLKNKGFKCINIKFANRSLNIFQNLKGIYDLYSIYNKIKPDIVHHFNPKPVLMGSIVAHLLKVKFIFNNYPGLGNLFRKDSIKYNLIKPFILLTYKFINSKKNVISIFQVENDKKLFIEKKIIGNSIPYTIPSSGVDLNKFKFRDNFNTGSKLKIAMVSRINFDKGIDVYFKIASKLKTTCKFYLAGQFYEHENPKLSKKKLLKDCVENQITYLSFIEDIKTLLNKVDVLILPTRRLEGVPKIILEACSSGVIPIASNIGGCSEIITDNVNGFLADVINDVEFVSKIRKINNNREIISKLAISGRKNVELYFEISKITQKYLKIYNLYN